jgi:phosphomannomutase
MRPLKIGISWVRGVVGETLTPELLVDFACAFGTFVDGASVAVGHDSRRSSPMVHAAVLAGLQSCGCSVVDLGLAPTPLVQFAIRSSRLAGGISITASHNDAKWNALKFIGKEGMLLNSYQSEEVMDIYHLGEFRKNPWNSLGKVQGMSDMSERYFDYLLARLDVPSIRKARFKIVSDCCAGAGSGLIPAFLERLGCKVIRLNDEPDGEFPHPPEPNVRNMKGVASVVKSVEADLGISVNADADRLGFVAEGGNALSEEYVFPIVADYLLDSTRGPVVSTLSTSRMVESAAARHRRKVIYARIGEGYVVERVLGEKAAVGGEGSGGVVVPKWNRWFDAFSTVGIVLQCMARTGATLGELAHRFPRYYLLKGALPSSSERTYPVLEAFRKRYHENSPNLEDGVRVDWPDAWLHVRASNTEPLVRIIVEAEAETRARDLYDQSIDQIARVQAGRGNE